MMKMAVEVRRVRFICVAPSILSSLDAKDPDSPCEKLRFPLSDLVRVAVAPT
jgi:hypothetical protein